MSATSQLTAPFVENTALLENPYSFVSGSGAFRWHGKRQFRLFFFDDQKGLDRYKKIVHVFGSVYVQIMNWLSGGAIFPRVYSSNTSDSTDLLDKPHVRVGELDAGAVRERGASMAGDVYASVAVNKPRHPAGIRLRHGKSLRIIFDGIWGAVGFEPLIMKAAIPFHHWAKNITPGRRAFSRPDPVGGSSGVIRTLAGACRTGSLPGLGENDEGSFANRAQLRQDNILVTHR